MSSRSIVIGSFLFCLAAACVAPFLGKQIDFGVEQHRMIFFEWRLPRTLLGLG